MTRGDSAQYIVKSTANFSHCVDFSASTGKFTLHFDLSLYIQAVCVLYVHTNSVKRHKIRLIILDFTIHQKALAIVGFRLPDLKPLRRHKCGCCEMKSSVPHCYFTFLKITSVSTYFILFKIILAVAIAVKKLSFSFLAYILLFGSCPFTLNGPICCY